MIWGEGRHDQVAEELSEWWQDLWAEHTGSRVLLLAVPPGWGRSAVLDRFCEAVVAPDGPVGLVARIDGSPLGREVQAFIVQRTLAKAAGEPGVLHRLDLDRFPGQVQLAMGVAGLFISGIGWAASLLAGSLAVTARANKWDASPGGEQGAVARAGRELARVSAQIPAAVIIDDADTLDLDLALALLLYPRAV